MTLIRLILTLLTLVLTSAAWAEPIPYQLDRENSVVGFTYVLNGAETNGRIPIARADVVLDLDRFAGSRVTAILAADNATAGAFFATDAMKGTSVLNTDAHPTITFESTRVRPTAAFAAKVDGDITIRGVTRPITLDAQLFRPQGATGFDRLSVRLQGSIDRRAFGASGFPQFVGPEITLDIITRVRRP